MTKKESHHVRIADSGKKWAVECLHVSLLSRKIRVVVLDQRVTDTALLHKGPALLVGDVIGFAMTVIGHANVAEGSSVKGVALRRAQH